MTTPAPDAASVEPAHPRWFFRAVWPYLVSRSVLGIGLLAAVTPLTFCGGWHRFLELTTHFVAFYAGAALVLTMVAALGKQYRWAVLGALVLSVHAARMAPWYVPRAESGPPNLRLLISNVFTDNANYAQFLAFVEQTNPDYLVLMETNEAWVTALAPLDAVYPHSVKAPQEDNFGLCVYSRMPLDDVSVRRPAGVPMILATLEIDGRRVRIAAVHTLPPARAADFADRNAQLDGLAQYVADSPDRFWIIAGDLNTALWSPYYIELERRSGLVNTRRGYGILPTWPSFFGPFMVPVDHCLADPAIDVADCRTGARIGSDHLPLIVALRVPAEISDGATP